jgi:hypothetical protein
MVVTKNYKRRDGKGTDVRQFAVVAILILSLLLTGCTAGRGPWESPMRGLDDRPVLKACAYGAVIVGVAALVVGVALANGWLDDQDHYHRRHPSTPAWN